MAEEATPKRKPGRPMKKAESAPFVGFTKELIQDTYFRMPAIWIDVCAEIDNLAELKVVQYVLRHTWGYQDYEGMKHITIDEFVNGRKRRDGSRIDSGTGLSESAVREGIERAIKHGFLLCVIDDSDRARIKKYYALHMQEEVYEDFPEEDYADNLEVVDNCAEVVNNYPDTNYKLPRSSKNKPIEQTRGKRIRIAPPLKENNEEGREDCPEEKCIRQFIKEKVEGLSRTLGDHEHIGSNIVQAYNLFQQSGMAPDTFAEALYEAKDKAQKRNNIEKKNSKGGINRMPYFFMCLRQDVKSTVIVSAIDMPARISNSSLARKETNMDTMKIKVKAGSTPEELAQLQALGCADKPYLTFPAYVIYTAKMSQETADEARKLECVLSVEKMPTYSVR